MYPWDCASVSHTSRYRSSTFYIGPSHHCWSGALYKGARRQDVCMELSEFSGLDCACSHKWSQDRGRNQGGNGCKKGQQVPSSGWDYGCLGDDGCLCRVGSFRNDFECMGESLRSVLTLLVSSDACEKAQVVKQTAKRKCNWVQYRFGIWRQIMLCFAIDGEVTYGSALNGNVP